MLVSIGPTYRHNNGTYPGKCEPFQSDTITVVIDDGGNDREHLVFSAE